MSYVDLAEFKLFLRTDDDADDFTMQLALDSAEHVIARHLGQTFVEADTEYSVVRNAILLQANRFYKRRDAWAGIAGSPDMGNEMRLLSTLDFDVKVMLNGLRSRTWWIVNTAYVELEDESS